MTVEDIISAAGLTVFQKGLLYAREGAVRHITVDSDQVHAQVQGSTSYTVALRLDMDELTIRCNCPAAVYQPLCKHGVALALVYLEHDKNGTAVSKNGKTQTEQLSEWLLTWDKSELVAMLMQYIVDNDEEEERWLVLFTGWRFLFFRLFMVTNSV